MWSSFFVNLKVKSNQIPILGYLVALFLIILIKYYVITIKNIIKNVEKINNL